jgi:hypothetical protein
MKPTDDDQQITAARSAADGAMAMVPNKTQSQRTRRVSIPDDELIARLEDGAPEVLTATIPEAVFDATVKELLKESPTDEVPHFYCRRCGEYHLKTHAHHRGK